MVSSIQSKESKKVLLRKNEKTIALIYVIFLSADLSRSVVLRMFGVYRVNSTFVYDFKQLK